MSSHTPEPTPQPAPEAGTNLGPRPTGVDDKEIEPPRRKPARVSRRER